MPSVATLPRPVPAQTQAIKALSFWHAVTRQSLHVLPYDLSARQMALLLMVYLEAGPHSIKSLSEALHISKPAICRAVDTLETIKFLRRQRVKEDKRNVVLQRTVKGSVFLSEFADVIVSVSREA